MMRSLTLCLVLSLALTACGGSEDPSANNDANNSNNTQNNNTNNNLPDQGNNNTNNNPNPDQGNNNNNNNLPDMETDLGDMGGTAACTVDDRFNGQIVKDGSTITTTNSYGDAGLAALWTAIDAKNTAGAFPADDPNVMGTNECNTELTLDAPIAITGAVVTSTAGRRITVQDKNKAMLLFFSDANYPKNEQNQNVTFKVGQKVDFKVVGVTRYACNTPEVTKVSDFAITKASGEPIYVEDVTGEDITVADHYLKVVRVGGTLTNLRECGRRTSNNVTYVSRCFDLVHGPEGAQKTVTLRSESGFACEDSLNKCATFIGPVVAFPEYYSDAPVVQLNANNFDWARFPYRDMQCSDFGM